MQPKVKQFQLCCPIGGALRMSNGPSLQVCQDTRTRKTYQAVHALPLSVSKFIFYLLICMKCSCHLTGLTKLLETVVLLPGPLNKATAESNPLLMIIIQAEQSMNPGDRSEGFLETVQRSGISKVWTRFFSCWSLRKLH